VKTKKPKKPFRTEAQKKHARDADRGAKQLVKFLKHLNRDVAETYVRENPPPVSVIVGMAFFRQRKAAKKLRPTSFTRLLDKVVREFPDIKTPELIRRFEEGYGSDVINWFNPDETYIEYRNGPRKKDKDGTDMRPTKKVKLASLRQLLSNARKRRDKAK
jgi:hypothetical protein